VELGKIICNEAVVSKLSIKPVFSLNNSGKRREVLIRLVGDQSGI
jgi:hypothetical protein